MQGPEIIYEHVEDAENEDQHYGAEFGLEAHDHHDARYETEHADGNPANGPLSREDEANEEEDQKDSTGELEVHLAVFLVNLRKTGRCKLLADPAIGKDHQETAHDGKIAQEEVEVEDQAIAKGLRNDNRGKTGNGLIGFPS